MDCAHRDGTVHPTPASAIHPKHSSSASASVGRLCHPWVQILQFGSCVLDDPHLVRAARCVKGDFLGHNTPIALDSGVDSEQATLMPRMSRIVIPGLPHDVT